MSFQIPNSNQFSAGNGAVTYTPSDFTFWSSGADLPDSERGDIKSDQPIEVELTLRRNQFNDGEKPEGFIPADQILDLSYKEQIEYIRSLSEDKLISWYGASDQDLAAVSNYLAQFEATDVSLDKEQRRVNFTITFEQFKNAFLNDRPEIVANESDGSLYYYNPNDYAGSYLTADGSGAQEFASAITGVDNVIAIEDDGEPEGSNQPQSSGDESELSGSKGLYYPTEIAKLYNFPSSKETNGGRGVTIGLIAEEANQVALFNQGNAFNKYLRAQNINIRRLGTVNSPNDNGDPDADWGELGIDYSILRSIAPRANLIISNNDTLPIADLVYNKEIDIISSSFGYEPVPGQINLSDVLHELFLDAVLRGKSIVQAAGDSGTGNYEGNLLPNGKPFANVSDGDSAILSVGGTALAPKAKPNQQSSAIKKISSTQDRAKALDEITGLVSNQLMWNEYSFVKSDAFQGIKGVNLKIYPSFQEEFSIEDFRKSTVIAEVFDNAAGSSGVFAPEIQPMPGYQQKNLEDRWQGTGRLYPDVSVLAGGNTANGAESSYIFLDLQDGKPVLAGGGGTSAGAPLLAGLLANITSGLRKKFGKDTKIGLVNPYLYEQYNSKRGKDLLIDVPKGSNNASTYTIANSPDEWPGKYAGIAIDPDTNHEYLVPLNGTRPNGTLDLNLSSTGKGFDAASGLGSINGQALFDGLMQVWSSI